MKHKNLSIQEKYILYNKDEMVLYLYTEKNIKILYKNSGTISIFEKERYSPELLQGYYIPCRKLNKDSFRYGYFSIFDKIKKYPFFRFFLENEKIEVFKSIKTDSIWILIRFKKNNKLKLYRYKHSISI